MKSPKYIIAAVVGLMPSLGQSNDLTGGNFAVAPSSASSGLQNFVPGTVSLGNGFFNNVSGPANFVTGQNNQSFGSFISILGFGNLANASAITCTIIGSGNQVSTRESNIFGNTLSDGGFTGSTVIGDGNPFAIRTFAAPFASSGTNSFNAVFNAGYQFRTNDGQGMNGSAGVYFRPSSPNTASTSFPAFIGVNKATPADVLDLVTPSTVNNYLRFAFSAGATGTSVFQVGRASSDSDFKIQDLSGNVFINCDDLSTVPFVGLSGQINAGFPVHVGTDTTNGNGARCTTTGVWTDASSRTFKENFKALNSAAILEKVVELPVRTWNYRGQEEVQHIGPVAEDFHAAFGVGDDEKYLASLDTNGVALVAIQGLNQVVQEKDRKIRELEERLDRIEKLLLDSDR